MGYLMGHPGRLGKPSSVSSPNIVSGLSISLESLVQAPQRTTDFLPLNQHLTPPLAAQRVCWHRTEDYLKDENQTYQPLGATTHQITV